MTAVTRYFPAEETKITPPKSFNNAVHIQNKSQKLHLFHFYKSDPIDA